MQNKIITGCLLSLATIAALGTTVQAANVTQAMLSNTAKDPKSVLSFGMGTEGQRYSPLTQINTKTSPS